MTVERGPRTKSYESSSSLVHFDFLGGGLNKKESIQINRDFVHWYQYKVSTKSRHSQRSGETSTVEGITLANRRVGIRASHASRQLATSDPINAYKRDLLSKEANLVIVTEYTNHAVSRKRSSQRIRYNECK